jgi:hypothetical protein
MNNNNTFWQAEYENVSGQFQKFLDLYVKTFGIYLAILGGLLKFALDKWSTPTLTLAMSTLGLLCCALLFACIVLAETMTRKLRRKRKVALDNLQQVSEDEFVAGHWASLIFGVFNVLAIAGWIYVIAN